MKQTSFMAHLQNRRFKYHNDLGGLVLFVMIMLINYLII